MAANSPNSPRQKMINLMYLVFIAMMALNVSSEVLDGFELVEESLLRSVKASNARNEMVFAELEDFHTLNPEKTQIWYDHANLVKTKTDSLYTYIQDLKTRIAKNSDGKDGNPELLKHPDDLNAAYEVMFEKGKNDGKKLRGHIDAYRTFVTSLIGDSTKRHIIEANLSTEPSKKAKENHQTWEEAMFDKMPMAAAITLLTKMQNDIRYAEGEVLSDLIKNIDVRDFRVNKVSAFVIPTSQNVIRGGQYSADIVLSAQDSTQQPRVFVNGQYLPQEANGRYAVGAGSVGTFQVKGFIEMNRGDGSVGQWPFQTEYFVQEPNASIELTLMNALYAGIDNPFTVAVPGVPSQNINVTMTNGTISRNGSGWVAKPSKVGTDAVFTVTANIGGRVQEMTKKTCRVRELPDPTPYIEYKDEQGNTARFKKSGRLSRNVLANANDLKAAIDDGLLNIEFQVLKFQTMTVDGLGNSIIRVSNGNRFSQEQKDQIRQLQRGKFVIIRGIVAKGPDGRERDVAPIEVIIN